MLQVAWGCSLNLTASTVLCLFASHADVILLVQLFVCLILCVFVCACFLNPSQSGQHFI